MGSIQDEIAKLKSEEVETRLCALNALAGLPDGGAIDYAIEALSDGEWRIRKAAVTILAEQVDRGRIVRQLIDRLGQEKKIGEKNIGMRNAAVEVFIQIGSAAVQPLLFSLSRADADIRKLIVDTLGEIGDKRSVPDLMKLLSDENENVAASAVEALGKLRDPAAVGPLIEILKKDNPLLVFSAMRALQQMGNVRAVEPLIEILNKNIYRRGALEVLGSVGDIRAVPAILSALQSGPKGTRSAALKALAALMEKQSETDRIGIRKAIKKIYDGEIYSLLMEALQDPDLSLQRAGICALGWVEEVRATSSLFALMLGECQDEVMTALVEIGKKGVDPLILFSKSQKEGIRELLAAILGRVGDRKSVPVLLEFLRDNNGHVRQAAAAAMGKIKDPSAVEALLPLVGDPYSNVQEAAVKALLEMKGDLPRGILLQFLRHEIPSFRSNALFILGQIRAPEMIPSLGLLLRDPEKEIRKIAVEVLDASNLPELLPHLLLALGDESAEVRLAALKVLARKETRPLPDLIEYLQPLLSDESIWVRSAIPPLLARLPGEKTQRLLLELLADQVGVVKIAALSVLGERKESVFLPLALAETNNSDIDVRKAAVLALGRLGEPSVMPLLHRFLIDPNWTIRVAAIHAIGCFRDRAALPSLETLSHSDEDLMVREAARAVLSQIGSGGGPTGVGNE